MTEVEITNYFDGISRRMLFWLQILILTFTYSRQQSIPGVLWDPKNPIFDQDLCTKDSRKLVAKLHDELSILCGNPILSEVFQNNIVSQRDLFNYNVYLTSNIDVYNKRNGSEANLIYNCEAKKDSVNNQNFILKSYKLQLSKDLPPGYLGKFKGFSEGQSYWIFTTSNGTKSSLHTKVGSPNSIGVEIEICKENDLICEKRKRLNLCIEQPKNSYSDTQSQAAATGERSAENLQSTFRKPEFIISAVLLALIIGLLVGFVVGFKKKQRSKKQDQDGHRRTGNKVGRQCSTMSQVPMITDDSETKLSPEV